MRQIMQAVTKKMDSMHVRVSRFFLIYVCVFVCRSTLCSDNSSSKLDTLYLSLYGKYLKSGLHVCEWILFSTSYSILFIGKLNLNSS